MGTMVTGLETEIDKDIKYFSDEVIEVQLQNDLRNFSLQPSYQLTK